MTTYPLIELDQTAALVLTPRAHILWRISHMVEKISFQEVLDVALSAAKTAGSHIKRSWTENDVKINYKDCVNLVTQYDLESERIIIELIKARFPTHGLLTEETNSSLSSSELYQKPLWIVDPIDGTTNFAHRHPHCAVSIGFSVEGRFRVGVVHNPFTDETYQAIEGQGAFLNDRPIRCKQTTDLSHALIATGFPYKRDDIDDLMDCLKAVLIHCREVRRLGAASLDICWVADGKLDGFYETLSPWDIAAATVIAREAGLVNGHIKEPPKNLSYPTEFFCEGLLYANPELFQKLQKLLGSTIRKS